MKRAKKEKECIKEMENPAPGHSRKPKHKDVDGVTKARAANARVEQEQQSGVKVETATALQNLECAKWADAAGGAWPRSPLRGAGAPGVGPGGPVGRRGAPS